MPRLVSWDRVSTWLDQYGRAETVLSLVGRIGPVIVVVGAVFGAGWSVLQRLPLFSQIAIAVGIAMIVFAGVGRSVIWFRKWLTRQRFNVVALPSVRASKVELFINNRGKTDDFKVRLQRETWMRSDDYPRALEWRDSRDEHRTIFGTSGEVLNLFDYEVQKPGIGLPPEVILTIPCPTASPSKFTIQIVDYQASRDAQFGGEIGEAMRTFHLGVVGRDTPAK